MNCQGCKEDMAFAYELQQQGKNIAMTSEGNHFLFVAFDDEGVVWVW